MFFSSLVMADDWADENETTTGKSFGYNGNYKAEINDNGGGAAEADPWGDDNDTTTTNGNSYSGGDRGDKYNGGGRGDSYSGGRGDGGGFRGGRGGRGGGRGGGHRGDRNGGDRNGYGGGDNESNGFGGGDDRPRRGGGRGGGRGGRGGFDNNKEGGEEFGSTEEKKRELYIPPEPTEDENEIFGSGISSGINFNKYDAIPVRVSGENAPKPITSFDDSGLKQYVLDNVKKSGYTTPTPIQKNAIPVIMDKRDLMACAQTGSGKTASFLLPIIHDLLAQNTDLSIGKPQALIVSPTRELSLQIFEEARKFALGSYLKLSIVYGGTATKHQGDNIAKGCHILVATPGRLLDFVDRGYIDFTDTRFIVLDEADRMLDMGFKPAVEKIMTHPTRLKSQNLMFSATFPEDIQRLAGQFLDNYIFICVGIVGGACSDIEQNLYQVSRFEKRKKLTEILEEDEPGGTMVFVETKRSADFLASLLSETKFPTTSIHGDRLQREREQALRDFKTGKMKVLIATSVAARGLDIKNVAHVVNYDLPKSIDEYVHRIGRTGRVGNRGKATSFYDPDQDSALAPDLVRILEQAEKPIPEFLKNVSSGGGGGGGGRQFGGRDVRNGGIDPMTGQGSAEPEALEPEEAW